MKVYCCHHTPASERKIHMQRIFARHRYNNVHWIESALPDSIEVKNVGTVNCPNARQRGILNPSEISLCLKHKHIIDDMILNNCDALIFEDDVEDTDLLDCSLINRWIYECKQQNGDLLFIGSCANLIPSDIRPDQHVYFSSNYRTRCTHLYFVDLKCAKLLQQGFLQIKHSPDWQLNEIIDNFKLTVGWVHPPILQMTDIGITPSLLT